MVGSIVQIVRPLSREEDAMVDTFAYQPLVQPLYDAIFPRLSAHDIDQVRGGVGVGGEAGGGGEKSVLICCLRESFDH